MQHYLVHEIPPLQRGSMLRVENGREMLVNARHGCVWLTQVGERLDIVLQTGQQFRISRDGCTLIQALRDSEVDLLSPEGRPLAQRIALVTAGGARSVSIHEAGQGLYAPPRRARQIV